MKRFYVCCWLISHLLLISFITQAKSAQAESNGVYIVYMGAVAASSNGALRNDHLLLLSSLRRKKNAVLHNYKNGFSGFAAQLAEEEAQKIAQQPGVVSVFPDPLLQLHTTRSWDFLKYQTGLEVDIGPSTMPNSSISNAYSDAIIGILDTGIWPESESFNDNGFGPIPPTWKGTCMTGPDFASSNCNRKLIGAKYYKDASAGKEFMTPRDMNGHGTHVASTAAGNPVPSASYYGLALGSAKGGSPGSRIAMYRVCESRGCRGSAIMAAFDDAIKDGVDVLSLSLGSSAGYAPNFQTDPIAIGAFHAVEKGITVVCSAGNDGPERETVVNVAPWILTVAATTIDRDFEADIILGDNTVIKGGGINFGNIQKSPIYRLLYGSSVKQNSSTYKEEDARNCIPDALNGDKVKGNIILCKNKDGQYSGREKLTSIKEKGGIGMIFIDNNARIVASSYGSFPMATVTSEDGRQIISYINTTRNPIATILPTVSLTNYKPAPLIPDFSSRGPSFATKNILKPDVAAPGVDILASWPGNDSAVTLAGRDPPLFYLLSGTSMACPHVSGLAAIVKSQNPNWTPSAIKSAIMTTASQTNNMKMPITTNSGSVATPFDYGAGEVTTSGLLQPGLVYETEMIDYLLFLCNIGYNVSNIKLISSTVPAGFSCPSNSNANLISNMNYPSIAVSTGNDSRQVNRTVTNIEGDETTYTATVNAPTGLEVKVTPDKLQFTQSNKKMTYQVIFTYNGKKSAKEDLFGSITWSNGKYKVWSPFVVSSN